MTDQETSVANFFETTLTSEMLPTDLTATVDSTTGLTSPTYLVIEPDTASQREVILFDGTFTATSFVTSTIANRYLSGSAAGSGLTHPVGSIVRSAPLAQHIVDLNDRVDVVTEVDASTEVASVGLTVGLDTVASVALSIPASWAEWKCEAWASYVADGAASGQYDVVISIDGSLQQRKLAVESDGVRSDGAIGGRRTGITTTGSRTVALQAALTGGTVNFDDIFLYARALRTA